MSADQLRRAADHVSIDELLAGVAGSNTTAAVAALLRAAADFTERPDVGSRRLSRIFRLIDDVAAAHLGEQVEP